MAVKKKSPLDPIRLHAAKQTGVEASAVFTQGSFKVGKKSFLFSGQQGGRKKS